MVSIYRNKIEKTSWRMRVIYTRGVELFTAHFITYMADTVKWGYLKRILQFLASLFKTVDISYSM